MNRDHELTLLRDRLERLEGAQRRYRRAGAAVLLLAALPLAAFVLQDPAEPAKKPQTLQLQTLEIVDSEGKVRAHFGMNDNGHPELMLRDKEEKERLLLQIAKRNQEPALFLRDIEEMNRLTLIIDAAGNPHVVLSEKGQKPRAQMTVSERGAPSLSFRHRDGNLNAGIGLHADGKAWTIPELPSKAGDLPDPKPLPVTPGSSTVEVEPAQGKSTGKGKEGK